MIIVAIILIIHNRDLIRSYGYNYFHNHNCIHDLTIFAINIITVVTIVVMKIVVAAFMVIIMTTTIMMIIIAIMAIMI